MSVCSNGVQPCTHLVFPAVLRVSPPPCSLAQKATRHMGKGGAIINIASIQVSPLCWACSILAAPLAAKPALASCCHSASCAIAHISYNADNGPPVQAYQPMYGIMDYASTKVRWCKS